MPKSKQRKKAKIKQLKDSNRKEAEKKLQKHRIQKYIETMQALQKEKMQTGRSQAVEAFSSSEDVTSQLMSASNQTDIEV